MKPSIVVLDGHTLNPGDLNWDSLSAQGDLTVYDRSGSQVIERSGDAEILLTNKTVISAEHLKNLPKLQYIGVLATGYNVVDLSAARDAGIVVTNVPGYSSESVAQHVFALLLQLAGHTAELTAATAAGEWQACPDFSFTTAPMIELAGKTLGIVGLGAIGKRVARIADALGMRIAVARHRPGPQAELSGVEIDSLPIDSLCETADVLTLHCPLTDNTRHLINAERLARMKPSALLINTGRGPLIDELALFEALQSGQIAGAGLDVLSVEPPSEGNPLLGAPRCLITPHVAWATVEARQRLMQIASDNVTAFLAGEPVNVVG